MVEVEVAESSALEPTHDDAQMLANPRRIRL